MDSDSPWKELAEHDGESLLEFAYPDIHADLDWARGTESLEQEFRKIHPGSATGKRIADKLLRGFRKEDGEPRYLHLEVQGRRERGFRRRVYVYNYRAEDVHSQPVASLVLLVDDAPGWFPKGYRADVYGSRRTLRFRAVKVLSYRGREAELEAHPNPVGLFFLAHLEGRRLRKDEPGRAAVKKRLILRLRDRGMVPEELRHWYRYLDWLLPLSPGYDRQLWDELNQSREEKDVAFVTFAEKVGIEKGIEQGIEQGRREGLRAAVRLGLELKFGAAGLALVPRAEAVEDLATLQAVCDAIKTAAGIDDVARLLPVEGHS
jgi:hypothetical protein